MESNQPRLKRLFIFSSIIFIIISILCIINYSVNQTLSWALYPIGALILLWATIAPAIGLTQVKLIGSFAGMSLTLIPFLYLVAKLCGDSSWFFPLALPLALSFLISFSLYIICVYWILNKWLLTAAAFFLFGVILNFIVGEIISSYLINQEIQGEVINRSTIFFFSICSAILAVIGFSRKKI